ncbi:hypothetical protein EK21DRAFT_54917, partial [Setomelanomma holmii]
MSDSNLPPTEPPSTGGSTDNSNAPLPTRDDLVRVWLRQTFLDHQLEDGGNARITTQEFTDLTSLEFPEAYMPEHAITLALALATREHKRSDVIVLSDGVTQILYALGIGRFSLNSPPPVIDVPETTRQAVLNESKRWIVVPVSDGLVGAETERPQSEERTDK